MFTYEPIKQYMDEHGLSYYDLEQTALSHGSVYNIKYDDTISLPVINYLMYLMNVDDINQIIRYYREGTILPPPGVKTLPSVDTAFDKFYNDTTARRRKL